MVKDTCSQAMPSRRPRSIQLFVEYEGRAWGLFLKEPQRGFQDAALLG